MSSPAGTLLRLVRGFAAFILNIIVAMVVPPLMGGQFIHRFLRTNFPSTSAAERELIVGAVMVALVAFAVGQFWPSKTAKWIWVVPVPLLLLKMAMFSLLHSGGSVMENHSNELWRHFFSPDSPIGRNALDFSLFTLTSVRMVVYSSVAWASARWAVSRPDDPVIVPASNISGVTAPMMMAGKFRLLTVTNLLIGINAAVFAAMVASGASLLFPQTSQLIHWGASTRELTLHGQYWRLITSLFIHVGIVHLAGNMLVLWWVGGLVEKILGRSVLAGIYFLSGVAGGLLSLIWHTQELVGVGASGAILGVAGALAAILFWGRLRLPQPRLLHRRLSVVILYPLFIGISPGADNVDHLGGLATGIFIGFCIARSLQSPSSHAFANARLLTERTQIRESSELAIG